MVTMPCCSRGDSMNCGIAVNPSSPCARQGCELGSTSAFSILPKCIFGHLADRVGGMRPCTCGRPHSIFGQPGSRSGANHGGKTLSLRRQHTKGLRLQRVGAIQLWSGWDKNSPWHTQSVACFPPHLPEQPPARRSGVLYPGRQEVIPRSAVPWRKSLRALALQR